MTVNKNVPWLVTAFLVCLVWLQTCRLNRKIEQGEKVITQLQLDKQTLTETTNKQGKTIKLQDAILVNNTTALNRLTDTIFDLKKKDAKNTETIAYYKGVTRTEIVKVNVPYKDTTGMKEFSDSLLAITPQEVKDYIRDSTIQVPRVAELTNPNFSLAATVKKQELTIDALVIPDTLQLRFVEHKGGLFKPNTVEVQYFHSNPYVLSVSANSAYYKPKKKSFFQRVILPIGIGVGAGILISK